jgi:hypothetical protein
MVWGVVGWEGGLPSPSGQFVLPQVLRLVRQVMPPGFPLQRRAALRRRTRRRHRRRPPPPERRSPRPPPRGHARAAQDGGRRAQWLPHRWGTRPSEPLGGASGQRKRAGQPAGADSNPHLETLISRPSIGSRGVVPGSCPHPQEKSTIDCDPQQSIVGRRLCRSSCTCFADAKLLIRRTTALRRRLVRRQRFPAVHDHPDV